MIKKFNLSKRIVSLSLMLVLGLLALGVAPTLAQARHRYMDERFQFQTNRARVMVSDDRQFFMRYSRRFMPRQVVLVDRANVNNRIVLSNYLTGPFSTNVNRVALRVDSDYFRRVSNNIRIDRDIEVDVNTGNNTVSFNTVVGDITTGDVEIDIR